jgi:hypothetical protein
LGTFPFGTSATGFRPRELLQPASEVERVLQEPTKVVHALRAEEGLLSVKNRSIADFGAS